MTSSPNGYPTNDVRQLQFAPQCRGGTTNQLSSALHSIEAIMQMGRSAVTEEIFDQLANSLRQETAHPSAEGGKVIERAYGFLSDLPPLPVCSSRVVALLCISIFQITSARPEKALAAATDAVSCARRLSEPLWLCKALKVQGVAFSESRNSMAALQCYAEAIKFAQECGDLLQVSGIWNNTGIAHLSSARYAEAIASFEQAINVAENQPELSSTSAQANSNIALASLHVSDIKRGLGAIVEAIRQYGVPKTVSEMHDCALAESHHARLLLEIGMVEEARSHCELAKKFATQSQSQRAEVLADIHDGHSDIGLTRLKRALEAARRDMQGTLQDALAMLIHGYRLCGQPDAALVYLRELQRLHQDGRERAVLLHHNLHLRTVDGQLDVLADASLEISQSELRKRLVGRDRVRAQVAMLEQQSVAAELHDDATGEHCYRVGRLASLLARAFGIDDDTCFLIDLAARMHDIGKLAIPDQILLKPGRFTPAEREIMETHTTAGADLLAKSGIPQMYVAEEIARHHHERFDGTGYPARLAGAAIPIAARVTALADVFDALTHIRPYKEAWPVADAIAEIARQRGKHFDPALTDLFLTLVPALQREHGDLDAFLGVDAKHSKFIQARKTLAAALKKDVNEQFEMRR